MTVSAFYLSGAGAGGGQRFCLLHEPDRHPPRAAVVCVHPWAEELNKTRRSATLQARALSAAGCAVLQIDLLGCGDSSADFGDARWSDWVDDVRLASDWLRERTKAPLWLWGIRAGCLLAVEASGALQGVQGFVFWQPVTSGAVHLTQFLRLGMAAQLIKGDTRQATGSVRERLAAGESVDVAGYRISPALAEGLERSTLVPPAAASHVHWLEVSSRDEPELSPASATAIERWTSIGHRVDARAVRGPAFWQTVEIETAPALMEATLGAFEFETAT